MRLLPQPGQRWRHYKGGTYRILALAMNEPDLRLGIVYVDEHSGATWFRLVSIFTGTLDDGVTYRFTLLDEGTA